MTYLLLQIAAAQIREPLLFAPSPASVVEIPSALDCATLARTVELLEEVVEDGIDDDDPFFLEKKLMVFFNIFAAFSFSI